MHHVQLSLAAIAAIGALVGGPITAPATAQDVSVPAARGPVSQVPAATPDFVGALGHGRLGAIPVAMFTPMDTSFLDWEDAQSDLDAGAPQRIGINRGLPGGATIDADIDGRWETLPDGSTAWSMTVMVPGAVAVRVHFADFDLPAGGRLVVSGEQGAADAYETGYEGELWTMAVPGQMVHVQYQGPAHADRAPTLVIDEISHIYREHFIVPAGGDAVAGLLTCHEDVMCHSDVDAIARDSVFTMDFVSNGGTYICSGGLLNDADPNTFRGYLLTANHCISTTNEAASVTAYWFYQRNGCNGSIPGLFGLPRSNGCALLATSTNTDFTLMRSYDDPENGQGFAAWTTSSLGTNAPVVGIHHPGGSWKRVSYGNRTSVGPFCGSTSFWWYCDWTLGTIEGGSSGSPLFNANWQVVGQLLGTCGGESGCGNQGSINNMYGRFNVSYTSMSSHLNSVVTDDAYEDNDSLATAAPLAPGSYPLHLVDFNDWFALDAGDGAIASISASLNSSDMDLDLFLRRGDNSIVSVSLSGGALESMNLNLPAGTYYLQVNKDSGWGGPYTLDIALTPDCNQNGIPDATDIIGSISQDVNGNGIPDECEDLGPLCPEDVDGSGAVDFNDLLAVLGAWGACPGCPEDLDGNDAVDFNDLLLVLGAWGACP